MSFLTGFYYGDVFLIVISSLSLYESALVFAAGFFLHELNSLKNSEGSSLLLSIDY